MFVWTDHIQRPQLAPGSSDFDVDEIIVVGGNQSIADSVGIVTDPSHLDMNLGSQLDSCVGRVNLCKGHDIIFAKSCGKYLRFFVAGVAVTGT